MEYVRFGTKENDTLPKELTVVLSLRLSALQLLLVPRQTMSEAAYISPTVALSKHFSASQQDHLQGLPARACSYHSLSRVVNQ